MPDQTFTLEDIENAWKIGVEKGWITALELTKNTGVELWRLNEHFTNKDDESLIAELERIADRDRSPAPLNPPLRNPSQEEQRAELVRVIVAARTKH